MYDINKSNIFSEEKEKKASHCAPVNFERKENPHQYDKTRVYGYLVFYVQKAIYERNLFWTLSSFNWCFAK